MSIYIDRIRVINYKSLRNIQVELDKNLTILIGQNNSGKTSILEAVKYAFNYSVVGKDCFFFSDSEPYDDKKQIIIDIQLKPRRGNEFDSDWKLNFGESIDLSEDVESFCFRTIIQYSAEKKRHENIKYIFKGWSEIKISATSGIGAILDKLNVYLFDAQRDMTVEMKNRNSVWGNATRNISIPSKVKTNIEKQLKKANDSIVKGIPNLNQFIKNFNLIESDENNIAEINPITKEIEELYSGMNILYGNKNKAMYNFKNVGLGMKNWAVFSTLKTAIEIENNKNKNTYSLILIEEPESHIHPQAQLKLFSEIEGIEGQKIITTHSPYLLSVVETDQIVNVRIEDGKTKKSSLKSFSLTREEKAELRRYILRSKGDLFFSKAIILFEGDTESLAFPIFWKAFFGSELYYYGVNAECVNGDGSLYIPFVKLAIMLNIPFYILSDGEDKVVADLQKHLEMVFDKNYDITKQKNIFILPNKWDYEKSLVYGGCEKEVESAINSKMNKADAVDKYISKISGSKAKTQYGFKNDIYDYSIKDGRKLAMVHILWKNKTDYAIPIANEIVKTSMKFPPKVKDLLKKVKSDLSL